MKWRLGAAKASWATKKQVTHFTHPEHPLVLVNLVGDFICGGCKATGSGVRYHCSSCSFNLHESCATCPENISFFGHPHHRLALVPTGKDLPGYAGTAVCDICFTSAEGMLYRCERCWFDLHPRCSLLPPMLRGAPAHPPHEMSLVPCYPRMCAVCGEMTKVWKYRCAPCGVFIHAQCVGDVKKA